MLDVFFKRIIFFNTVFFLLFWKLIDAREMLLSWKNEEDQSIQMKNKRVEILFFSSSSSLETSFANSFNTRYQSRRQRKPREKSSENIFSSASSPSSIER